MAAGIASRYAIGGRDLGPADSVFCISRELLATASVPWEFFGPIDNG